MICGHESMRMACAAILVAGAGCGRTDLLGGREGGCRTPCAPYGIHPGPCVEEHDAGADGLAESRSVYTYDGCLLVRVEQDLDGDGRVDLVVAYEHEGERIVRETRTHSAGIEVWTYGYDADGLRILVEADMGADGTIDFRLVEVRDSWGNVVDEREYSGSVLAGWTASAYDESGRIASVEEHQYFCIDGGVFTGDTVSRRTTFSYGASLIVEDVDGVECEVADGDLDMRTERVMDEAGDVLVERVDGSSVTPDRVDGVFDRCTGYAYDGSGRLVRVEWDGGWDAGSCDGVVDSVTTHSYHRGRLASTTQDFDADGDPEEVLSYVYDTCGNSIEWSAWREVEGRTVWRHALGYGCWE